MTYLHAGNGGLCFIDSVELDELCQPILVESRRLLKDTEGAGRQRGAPSLEVIFGPIGCDVDVAFVSDGTLNGPTGMSGGGAGGQSRQYLRTAAGHLGEPDQVRVNRDSAGEAR